MSKEVINVFSDEFNENQKTFKEKSSNNDGLYRPSLKDVKDGENYYATIRFLPNVEKDGKLINNTIERTMMYVDIDDDNLRGYIDSPLNFGEKDLIYTKSWRLRNSDNPTKIGRGKSINKSTKNYSYVLVIEDKQNPHFEGKILIYGYGYTIKEKIENERLGKITGKSCQIFNPVNGKDFRLVISKKGEFPNYDSSTFLESTPVKFPKGDKWVSIVNKEGKVPTQAQKAFLDFYNSKDCNLEDFAPKKWTDDDREKVRMVIEYLDTGEYTNGLTDDTFTPKEKPEIKEQVDENEMFGETTNDDDWLNELE